MQLNKINKNGGLNFCICLRKTQFLLLHAYDQFFSCAVRSETEVTVTRFMSLNYLMIFMRNH